MKFVTPSLLIISIIVSFGFSGCNRMSDKEFMAQGVITETTGFGKVHRVYHADVSGTGLVRLVIQMDNGRLDAAMCGDSAYQPNVGDRVKVTLLKYPLNDGRMWQYILVAEKCSEGNTTSQ